MGHRSTQMNADSTHLTQRTQRAQSGERGRGAALRRYRDRHPQADSDGVERASSFFPIRARPMPLLPPPFQKRQGLLSNPWRTWRSWLETIFTQRRKERKEKYGTQMNTDEHRLVSSEERGEGNADERRLPMKGENEKGLAGSANPFLSVAVPTGIEPVSSA